MIPKFPKPLWPDEEFKLLELSDLYCISNYGRLFTRSWYRKLIHSWMPLKLSTHKSGHLRIMLVIDAIKYRLSIHVLVAEHFIGPRPLGMECCHNNGIPTDNKVTNLRWDTHLSNMQDVAKHGTVIQNSGVNGGLAKLTDKQVIEIRWKNGIGISIKELSEQYNISCSAIKHIVLRNTWRHI